MWIKSQKAKPLSSGVKSISQNSREGRVGLQKELIVIFQSITEIEIEKSVYVHKYNILPHFGPQILDYSHKDHSREYWEGAPSALVPEYWGLYTLAQRAIP